jgi:HK97 family phage portal protein
MWPFTKHEQKGYADSQATVQGLPPVKWNTSSAKAFATEGYQRCVIAARCVSIISQSVATIPIKVNVRGKEVKNHPLLKLLMKPNPTQSGTAFMQSFLSFKLITGTSYVEVLRAGQNPKELWVYPCFAMKVVEPAKGFIPRGYVYDDGIPAHKRAWDVDQLNGYSDLLQSKTYNPMDPFYGQSPMAAAAFGVDQHNEANAWNMRLLQNASVPTGALVSKATLTEGQFARFKKELAETYQGSRNARRPMILSGDISWQAMSMSAVEMDWLEGKNLSAREIAGAYGVPTQVIPIQGDQTFANYEQARLALWQDTVIPIAEEAYEELGTWFSQMYKEEITIELVLDNVAALEPVRQLKIKAINDANYLTINEKREKLGLDPMKNVPGADMLYIKSGDVALLAKDELDAGPTDVAKTSMAAGQTQALTTLVTSVLQGTMPKDAAKVLAKVAYPAMPEPQIAELFDPLEEGSQEPPPPPGSGGVQGAATSEDEAALKAQVKAHMQLIGVT